MKERIINIDEGKLIGIYDDVFSYQETVDMFRFIRNSLYRTTGVDDSIYTSSGNQIYSNYTTGDLDSFGIRNTNGYKVLSNKHNFNQRVLEQIRVNFSYPTEQNKPHTDSQGVTFLYYANIEWNLNWGGHTLFLNDSLDDAVCVSLYRPNRVVVFDGSIPHMIMSPTSMAQTHRYSFVLQFGPILKP